MYFIHNIFATTTTTSTTTTTTNEHWLQNCPATAVKRIHVFGGGGTLTISLGHFTQDCPSVCTRALARVNACRQQQLQQPPPPPQPQAPTPPPPPSDKMMRWQCVGLQGSLLKHFIRTPLRFTSIIIDCRFNTCAHRTVIYLADMCHLLQSCYLEQLSSYLLRYVI